MDGRIGDANLDIIDAEIARFRVVVRRSADGSRSRSRRRDLQVVHDLLLPVGANQQVECDRVAVLDDLRSWIPRNQHRPESRAQRSRVDAQLIGAKTQRLKGNATAGGARDGFDAEVIPEIHLLRVVVQEPVNLTLVEMYSASKLAKQSGVRRLSSGDVPHYE